MLPDGFRETIGGTKRESEMRLAATVLTLLLGVGGTAWSTQCGPQPACAVVYPGSVVFVGRFLDPGVEWSMGQERPARLEVVEHFAGPDLGEEEIRIEGILPWINPKGLWLISAVRKKDSRAIQIDICGNTGPLAEHQEELDYLRRRRRGETATLISGSVEVFNEPIGGVEVVASGTDGLEYRTMSNSLGEYEFSHVAPGDYSMRLELSDPQSKLYRPIPPVSWEDIELAGDLARLGVARGSCAYASFALAHDGEISGRLFEENGDSASGVSVQLRSAEEEVYLQRDKSVESDREGSFRFVGVNSGEYRLGVNINKFDRRGLYRTTYYPDVAAQDEAQVIEVGKAEKVRGLELHLPPRRAERMIKITVVDPEGHPVEGARIVDAPTGVHSDAYYSVRPTQKTDAQGRAETTVAAGFRYAIVALRRPNFTEEEPIASRGLVIPPGRKPVSVRLVMDRDAADIDCGDDMFLDDAIARGTATCDNLPAEEQE